ncbi:MAG UNVERIFIED_CONTAM: hypothetical protein LVT10_05305 [Anaerolineae bacterium]
MRPFVLTRSATVGMQRYAQTWSGDNRTSWESLRYNIPMGLGMGSSGMPNVRSRCWWVLWRSTNT